MRIDNPRKWTAAVGAGLLATVALMSQAYAESTYPAVTPASEDSYAARVEDRATLRQAISTANKAELAAEAHQPLVQVVVPPTAPVASAPVTMQAAPVAMQAAPVPVAAPIQYAQPVSVQTSQIQVGPPAIAPDPEIQHLSKSELMRRERLRQEMKIEDTLVERLEELRLRDEKRRMDQLFANGGAVAVETPIETVSVTAAGTQLPAPATVVASAPAQQPVYGAVSQANVSSADDLMDEKTIISVQPRAGLGEMVGNAFYDVNPRYSAGVSVGVHSSDHVSFEVGWQFSEFGIAVASGNPMVQYLNAYGWNLNTESMAIKQNVIDAGIKLHMLGQNSRLRPFISGGGAYSISFLNYDQRILDLMAQDPYLRMMGRDYEMSSFLGYLGGGLDVRVSRAISVGVQFKYFNVFSARERTAANAPGALAGYAPYAYTGNTYADLEKANVGSSLARTNFYQILGNVSFTF